CSADCSAAFFFATSSSVVITAPFSPSIAQRVSAGNTVISTVPDAAPQGRRCQRIRGEIGSVAVIGGLRCCIRINSGLDPWIEVASVSAGAVFRCIGV
ncbi:hypothetical protein, partial [Mycolicibacterium sp. P9-22]|uniref:hypothetical protein n=1 Tax=Mycolicibacterium sp. P9-22 TaxID=2024613 RepID=UPI001D155FD8